MPPDGGAGRGIYSPDATMLTSLPDYVRPFLHVMRSRRSGEYALGRFAFSPEFGHCVGYDPPAPIDPEEMARRGLEIVLAELEAFASRDGADPAHAVTSSLGEQRRFNNTWQIVSISRSGRSRLELQPMQHAGGGHVGEPWERIFVRLPVTQKTFMRKLEQAFDAILGR